MLRCRYKKSVLTVFFLTVVLSINTQAEKQHDELSWSTADCQDFGDNGSEFDYCAELEFCEGGDNLYANRRRGLRRTSNEDTMYGYGMYGNDMDDMGDDFGRYNIDGYEDGMDNYDGGRSSDSVRYGWRIPGESCTWPGPLIRLQRGSTYGLFLRGSGTHTFTNMHTHGLHISGHGNSDDISRKVNKNNVIIYNWTIPEYHMGGTFWYHSHHHGSTESQVRGGAFGMLIVDDGENVGTDDENILGFLQNEKMLVASNNLGHWVSNGEANGPETFSLNANEWYRLRILTVNVNANYAVERVVFGEQCQVRAIAHDGIFRFRVPAESIKTEYLMGDSSRLDVAIKCDGNSIIHIDSDLVAEIKMSDTPGDESITPFYDGDRSWETTRPEYLADLRILDVDDRWEIKMGETNINGRMYKPAKPFCNSGRVDFMYDTVNEWAVTPGTHPLHVHMYPMQIISGGCSSEAHDVGEFYDTLIADGDRHDLCKVRMRFLDVGGKTVFHCHIFKHGDQGSMGFVNVVGGPVTPNYPRVHTCESPPCDDPLQVKLCSDRH